MPNEKERKKKGGKNKSKKMQAMKAAVKERHERSGPVRGSKNQPDLQKFKPGSANDRTMKGTTKPSS
jgi:hypothetical protein